MQSRRGGHSQPDAHVVLLSPVARPSAMASSPVQLPSSDVDGPSDASAGNPPDLTDSDGDVVPALAGQCCSNRCLAPFETATQLIEALDLWRQWVGGVSHEQHLDHVFQLLRDLVTASDRSRVVFRFLGQSVCRRAWSCLVQVSCSTMWKMQKACELGMLSGPRTAGVAMARARTAACLWKPS